GIDRAALAAAFRPAPAAENRMKEMPWRRIVSSALYTLFSPRRGSEKPSRFWRKMTALAVRSFLTMLVVVDPVGLVPMFLVLSGDRTTGEKRRMARRAVAIAASILLAFALGGSWLLTRLGISLGAFQVAGGMLLFWIAVRMVFAEYQRETAEEAAEARSRADVSVFPL